MLFWNRWNQESTGRVYFNISREKPAHTPDTPHVQPLSCKLEWTNQKHFYCFLLKPIRDNLAPGFPELLLSLLYMHRRALGPDSPLQLGKLSSLRKIRHLVWANQMPENTIGDANQPISAKALWQRAKKSFVGWRRFVGEQKKRSCFLLLWMSFSFAAVLFWLLVCAI